MAVINYITQIHLDYGALRVLQAECQRLGILRPLIITDEGVRKAGLVDAVLEQLAAPNTATVFDQTPQNPNEAAVRQAVAVFKQEHCDGLIAVGGGSSIDLAKGVAVCARHDGPLRQFAIVEGGLARISAHTAPLIAIPTTAGTGSEVGRGAILIVDEGQKMAIISPHVVPKSAICDPSLTENLPPMLTAATGMDAIAHCIETFLSPLFNPPAEGIALDGLRRGWKYIVQATRDPQNREARLNMMSASMQGALAFQKGLGCVHSLSHALGGLNPHLHHGTLNAILLPAVVDFNSAAETVIKEQKLVRLAHAMDLSEGPEGLIQALCERVKTLKLPTGLGQLGVTRGQFPAIIAGAMKDFSHTTNPRLATEDDYRILLQVSL